ncbi:unnamed protein product [Pleuronectes platessa]|uniref:Uncharacterized protein n=1 Tax=Pleuronectes platessa TaxID=8262 RepID=A0A9N7YJG9_PLEPL|nr:unnamed protein product [Pleuronectes platessa]
MSKIVNQRPKTPSSRTWGEAGNPSAGNKGKPLDNERKKTWRNNERMTNKSRGHSVHGGGVVLLVLSRQDVARSTPTESPWQEGGGSRCSVASSSGDRSMWDIGVSYREVRGHQCVLQRDKRTSLCPIGVKDIRVSYRGKRKSVCHKGGQEDIGVSYRSKRTSVCPIGGCEDFGLTYQDQAPRH